MYDPYILRLKNENLILIGSWELISYFLNSQSYLTEFS